VSTPSQTPQPTSLLDLPNVEQSDVLKLLRVELFLAVVPFIFLAAGSFIAIHRLPEGKAFVLEARGVGIFYDFMSALLMMVLFGFFYMFPSLWVRRSISIVYRVVFFLVFTSGLCWLESEKYIAVVQTGDSFVFVRRFPFGSTIVPAGSVASVFTRKTSAIHALRVTASSWRGIPGGTLECERVWIKDQRTMRVMDELALALGGAQADSLRPVAAPAGLR
jgi:hypothetical protein